MTFRILEHTASLSSRFWFVIFFLIPASIYFFLLLHYAQNIPATDDFNATLQFINKFVYEKLDYIQRISLFFSQHNEHRIAVSRLLALLLYTIAGEIDFRQFVILDSLFLIGFTVILLLIYKKVHPEVRWYNFLLPVILLFSPKSYETFLFVSGGSQSYTVLFFTVLAIWLLSLISSVKGYRRDALFGLSLIAAGLATFSFGSGFVVWIGGSVFLFYSYQWKQLSIWLLMGVLTCCYYFYDFTKSSNELLYTHSLLSQLSSILKAIILFPGASFMLYWPELFLTKLQVALCYGVGFISCCYFLYLFMTGYGKQCPLLFSLLIVAIGIDAILAVSRSGSGSAFIFTSRYTVFTSFIAIVTYAIIMQQRLNFLSLKKWPIILLAIAFINSLWVSVPEIETIYRTRQIGFESWYMNKTPTLYIDSKMQDEANRTINQAIQNGVFVPKLNRKK